LFADQSDETAAKPDNDHLSITSPQITWPKHIGLVPTRHVTVVSRDIAGNWDLLTWPWWLDAIRNNEMIALRPMQYGTLEGVIRFRTPHGIKSLSVKSGLIPPRDRQAWVCLRALGALLAGCAVSEGLVAATLLHGRHLIGLAILVGLLLPGALWGLSVAGKKLVVRGALASLFGMGIAALVSAIFLAAMGGTMTILGSIGHWMPASLYARDQVLGLLVLGAAGLIAGWVGAEAWATWIGGSTFGHAARRIGAAFGLALGILASMPPCCNHPVVLFYTMVPAGFVLMATVLSADIPPLPHGSGNKLSVPIRQIGPDRS
jgi:hypothetical protein